LFFFVGIPCPAGAAALRQAVSRKNSLVYGLAGGGGGGDAVGAWG